MMPARAAVLVALSLFLTCPALVALADGASATAAPPGALGPLSDDERRLVAAIPDEGTPAPKQHYFRSNEWAHDLLAPSLGGLGGVHVGVGSDQNYTMAALARSELLLLVDYDPKIPWVHRIYEVLVRASDTPDALIARLSPERCAQSAALVEQSLGSDGNASAIGSHLRKRCGEWYAYLKRVARTKNTWLSVSGHYAHIRALFEQGRIVARNGDLTATTTVRALGDAARKLGLTVRSVYFSNAEQFFRYTPDFQANMAALPTDDKSVVIRTVHSTKLQNATPDDPTEWHYMVQGFPDFVARMKAGYRTVFRFVRDVVAHRRETASGDALSLLGPSVPIAGKQDGTP